MSSNGRRDDHDLLAALNQLGLELGPFIGGILTDTLSVSEQLAFGWKLIRLAGRIRERVEQEPLNGRPQAPDGDAV